MIARTLLAFAFAAAVAQSALAADVLVFAAASLKDALDAQAKAFTAVTGDKVVASYGASSALAKQIESGAPADVYISADLDWMDYVDRRKLTMPGTRVDLLRNALVLVAPAGSTSNLRIAPKFGLAAALADEKLAMANPDSVPAGKYAKAALEFLGVWASVDRRVARAENVRAALVLVSRREAPFGIVYTTDAMADPAVRIVDTFPAASHPPIVYPAAILASSKSAAARPFLDYLKSAQAKPVWEKHGFVVVR